MDNSENKRKIMEITLCGRRKVGRPNLRRMDGMLQAMAYLKIRNFVDIRNRDSW